MSDVEIKNFPVEVQPKVAEIKQLLVELKEATDKISNKLVRLSAKSLAFSVVAFLKLLSAVTVKK